ncbi:MAG TPA: efflux RND transporter permease subunit, partial [Spirochaetota bacterium]|nr:efflux RND transporter permease subunit [Spirochaetota bacterium]
MISTIITKSVEKSVFTIGLALLLLAAGWAAYLALPIDAVPDITNVQVQIITPVPALTPDTIESGITYTVENAMNAIPGTTEVRSITRYGLSHVTVIFEEGYDLYRARQLVAEKIQTLNLPEGITPSLGPISTGLGEIYHYSLEAAHWERDPQKRLLQLMELRTLQEWEIKPRLLAVKGVTEVNTIGGYPKQYHVRPRPEAMRTYGIHFDDITTAVRGSAYNTGGGFIQQSAEQLLVQGTGLV